MKVIVTGGAGFIGSAVCRSLAAGRGLAGVVNVDKLTYAANRSSLASIARAVRLPLCRSRHLRSGRHR